MAVVGRSGRAACTRDTNTHTSKHRQQTVRDTCQMTSNSSKLGDTAPTGLKLALMSCRLHSCVVSADANSINQPCLLDRQAHQGHLRPSSSLEGGQSGLAPVQYDAALQSVQGLTGRQRGDRHAGAGMKTNINEAGVCVTFVQCCQECRQLGMLCGAIRRQSTCARQSSM